MMFLNGLTRVDENMPMEGSSSRRGSTLVPASVPFGNDGDEFHLYHGRIRYGATTRKWRNLLVRNMVANPSPDQPSINSIADARSCVDEVITATTILTEALHALYETPDLGNIANPLDELMYMLLCRRTRISTAQKLLVSLKKTFPRWEDVTRPGARQILSRILQPGGFVSHKTEGILGVIHQVQADFGRADLSILGEWPDERVLEYLINLPHVDLKSAQCVMLYSLGRSVFPADTHTITVLSRLGTLEPLVGNLKKLEHRLVQRRLVDAVPPRLRGVLHVNLVAHGQAVCGKRNPNCSHCPIKSFCAHWRQQQARRTSRRPDAPVLVDLFCGAGGLTKGFEQRGFKIALAVDSDKSACRTFQLNHPGVPEENIVCGDLEKLVRKRDGLRAHLSPGTRVDVLAAGLPCQGFSKVGYRTKPHLAGRPSVMNDPRNRLFRVLLRAVRQIKPSAVLVENVPEMRSAGRGADNILKRLERGLRTEGYTVQTFELNASDFGVPQTRNRLFVVAVRGVDSLPDIRSWLLKHSGSGETIHLGAAITDLPRLSAGEGSMLQTVSSDNGARKLLFQHEARAHNPLDLELFSLLEPGDDALVAFERGSRRLMRYSTDNFHDKYYRLQPEQPCRTIVSHLQKDANGFIHPHVDRGLTAREAARVQSFGDDYVFLGSRCAQFIQIGNAVPPKVAEAFAAFFKRTLRTRRKKRQGRKQ